MDLAYVCMPLLVLFPSFIHLVQCVDIAGFLIFPLCDSHTHACVRVFLCFRIRFKQCTLISRTIVPTLHSSSSALPSLASPLAEPFNPIGHLIECKGTAAAIASAGTLLPTAYNEPLAAAPGASDSAAVSAPPADWAVRFLDACLIPSPGALAASSAPSAEFDKNSIQNSHPPPSRRRLLTATRVRCVLSQRADLRANDHPALDAARQSGADRLATALSLSMFERFDFSE
jgi:hypothetical protein